jgi:hypothetical protein
VVDAAFSYPPREGARKFRADGHSRWAPRDFAPLNYLWQFNRGWISHQADDLYPCAVAFTPVYMAETPVQQYIPLRRPVLHWRAAIQLAPSAFLVFDRSDIALPEVARLHVPVAVPLALENEVAPESGDGLYLRLRALAGWQAPQVVAVDYPTGAPETFATREIRFESKGEAVAVFLVTVESGKAPVITTRSSDGKRIALQHPEFAVEVELGDPEKIQLIDPARGRSQTVPLRPDKL